MTRILGKSQETFVASSLGSGMTHPFSKPWLFSKNLCISDVPGVLGGGVRRRKGDRSSSMRSWDGRHGPEEAGEFCDVSLRGQHRLREEEISKLRRS